jgi:hypothetical protein
MRTILEKFAEEGGGLEACDLTEFLEMAGLDLARVPEPAREYFEHLPAQDVEIGPFTILAPESVYQEARQLLPSCGVVAHGFLTFARQASGDILVLDLRTGIVYLLNHDIYLSEKWIEPRYDPNLEDRDFPHHLPVNAENIVATAEGQFDDIDTFLAALE